MTGPRPQASAAARTSRAIEESAIAAVVTYVAAAAAESLLIRLVHPTTLELSWISEVLIAVAFGVAVYLWRHLQATRRDLSAVERETLVLETQLGLAADLQRRLLPAMPAPTATTAWAAALVPAGYVGGDLYDLVAVGPDRWMLLVADVSGKGIAAAMALTLVRATFRSLVRAGAPPALLVTRLSATLFTEWHGAPYVTCVVADIDGPARTVTCANAGHPVPVLVRAHDADTLDVQGPPAGLLPDIEYEAATWTAEPGARCVFVTDGITEAMVDDLPSAGTAIASAARASDRSAEGIRDAVLAASLGGPGPTGVATWSDDRTVVVVAWT